jgi:hypothetical protein
MKAAVCYQFGAPLGIEDIQIDSPREGEVQVAIAACAICHSDLSWIRGLWGGGRHWWPAMKRRAWWPRSALASPACGRATEWWSTCVAPADAVILVAAAVPITVRARSR